MQDTNLRIILKYTLAVGNYLNGTSLKGGAHGFKIDILEKLAEIKNTDSKSTVLQYVLEKATAEKGNFNQKLVLEEKEEDLKMLEKAAKLPIVQI